MRCPDCDTVNRDDAVFCGMCKRSFRAKPPRRSAPPTPPTRTPSGVWRALLDRLGASRESATPDAPSPSAPPEPPASRGTGERE